MTGVHSKVATIMKETESGTRCGRRTMYVSCRFIASGSISVMRYNNNNNTVQSESEEFNPGTHLPRPPRWLTTDVQHQDKAASGMVLTIAGKDSTEKALSRGLSLFGKKFKVQRYLSFGPDSQCTKCLAFGHHPSQCIGTQHCNICSLEHPAHLHTCGSSDCL